MADITEICANIKNYFLRDIISGTFDITSGTSPLSAISEGQYFRIVNSTLNDGVWCNTTDELQKLRNETFDGEIWLMAIPRNFEKLCDEINAWRKKYEALDSTNMSPFLSESFGGYSCSKSGMVTWQMQFAKRLNTYRRLSV